MKKLIIGLTVAVSGVLAGANVASAAAPPEWDHVEAWVTPYDGMRGDIYWSDYRHGSGTIGVYNNLNDNSCVALYDRIQVGGSYGGWRWVGSVCTRSYYPFPVSRSSSSNIQNWQFKVVHADRNIAAYDTNQPGGA